MKFLFPFHNYLGPGNPLDNGEPVNSADRIAQKHDWEYYYAKNQSDIEASDRNAIAAFHQDGSFSSKVGELGLSVKYLAENVFGNIYPTMSKHSTDKTHNFFNEIQQRVKENYLVYQQTEEGKKFVNKAERYTAYKNHALYKDL